MCTIVWVVIEVSVVREVFSEPKTFDITSEWQAKVIERAFRHKEQLASRP